MTNGVAVRRILRGISTASVLVTFQSWAQTPSTTTTPTAAPASTQQFPAQAQPASPPAQQPAAPALAPTPSAPSPAGAVSFQPPPPPRSPPPAPTPPTSPRRSFAWNLGAGLGWGPSSGLDSIGLGALAPLNAWVPSSRLALERLLAGGTWLVGNARASISQSNVPISNAGDPGVTRSELELTTTYLAVLIGIRQVVVSGIVDVSVVAVLGGGRTGISGDRQRAGESLSVYGLDAGDRTVAFGGQLGIALERELIPALRLRLAADLLAASFNRTRDVSIDSDGVATVRNYDAVAGGLSLAPALELHFYF